MGRGKRYDPDQKLNIKKVIAVLIALIVIIMFIVALKTILSQGNNTKKVSGPLKYYSVYTNEKWGVIDSNGDYVIEPTYEEMIIVPNNEKCVFLCMYDVNYNDTTYTTKAIDTENNRLFTEYSGVEPIENFDSANKMWYEENLLKVQKDGKFGLINIDGTTLAQCEYDNIYALKGYKNKIVTVKENSYGLMDNTGKVLISNSCTSEEQLILQCSTIGLNLELTTAEKSKNPKNIGRWHVSKDENSSYYTDVNN